MLAQYDGREGPERFAEFDLLIHDGLHARAARVAEDAARPERSWAELQASLKPADHVLAGNQFGDAFTELLVRFTTRVRRTLLIEHCANLLVGVLRAEQ